MGVSLLNSHCTKTDQKCRRTLFSVLISQKLLNLLIHVQACQKTCYQEHVVSECTCGDPKYLMTGRAVTGGSERMEPCTTVKQGELFIYLTLRTQFLFHIMAVCMVTWLFLKKLAQIILISNKKYNLSYKCQEIIALVLSDKQSIYPITTKKWEKLLGICPVADPAAGWGGGQTWNLYDCLQWPFLMTYFLAPPPDPLLYVHWASVRILKCPRNLKYLILGHSCIILFSKQVNCIDFNAFELYFQ